MPDRLTDEQIAELSAVYPTTHHIQAVIDSHRAITAENERLETALSCCDHENCDLAAQRTSWKEGYEAAMEENERLREQRDCFARTVLALLKHDHTNNPSDYVVEMQGARAALSSANSAMKDQEQGQSIPCPSFPPGVNVRWWNMSFDSDGAQILDEDMVYIELDNGYCVDFGAYGLGSDCLKLVVNGGRGGSWDSDHWEIIYCDDLHDATQMIIRCVNRWVKMNPVDPRILAGYKAMHEWAGPWGKREVARGPDPDLTTNSPTPIDDPPEFPHTGSHDYNCTDRNS